MRCNVKVRSAAVFGAVSFLVAGCGGGGSMVAGGPAAGTQTAHLGPITASYSATSAIVPIGGGAGSTSFAGLAGANFTAINFQAPHVLNQTLIAFSMNHGGSNANLWAYNRAQEQYAPLSSVTSFASNPAFSSDGRIAFIHDDTTTFRRLYIVNLDGSGLKPLTPAAVTVDLSRPSWSPDNTKIAYSAGGQIYVIPSVGGAPSLISDGTSVDIDPSWSPDGTGIIFSRTNASLGSHAIFTMAANGANPTQLVHVASEDLENPVWAPDGQKFAYVILLSTQNSNQDQIVVQHLDGAATLAPASTWNYDDPTWSPDGQYIAYQQSGAAGFGINVATYGFESDQPIVPPTSTTPAYTPAWQPFPRVRFLVGTGALMGSTCSGFLFAQQNDLFTGFINFSATTPSTASITTVAGGANSDAVYSLGGDTLTHINYFNGIYGSPVTAVPTGGLATAKGALVSFDQAGQISFVLPYSHSKRSLSKSGAIVFEGQFLGAWDKKGRNTMPHGATQVAIDGHSGKLLGIK